MSAENLSLQIRILFEYQLISITDTDFGLETNEFCNNFGYNGMFFWVIAICSGEEKSHEQNIQKVPRQSREDSVSVFLLRWFFRSQIFVIVLDSLSWICFAIALTCSYRAPRLRSSKSGRLPNLFCPSIAINDPRQSFKLHKMFDGERSLRCCIATLSQAKCSTKVGLATLWLRHPSVPRSQVYGSFLEDRNLLK